MKPVKQTVFSNPKTGKLGNCFAACLASLLEVKLGQVPRFQLMKRNQADKFVATISQHGCVFRGIKSGLPEGPGVDGYFIVSCFVIGYDIRHCVIWKNDQIVFDPRDGDVKLGQMDGYYDIRRKE